MQEQYRLAVRAVFRLAVAEYARALRTQRIACRDNVIDLVTDVVDATVGHALEEFRDRGILAKWRNEFDLGVRQRDENSRHTMRRLRHRLRDLRTQHIAI